MMPNGWVALVVLCALFAGLRAQGEVVGRRLISGAVSRKLAHVALGLVLLLSWAVYDEGWTARWFAALPPLCLVGYFVALGSGVVRDERTIGAASRSGHASEMLAGPTLYVLVFAMMTVALWRSPVAITALSVLVFGDGLAEPVGRSVPSPKLPWTDRKSWAGTGTVAVAGALGALAVLALFGWSGVAVPPVHEALLPVAVAALAGAAAEGLTPGFLDNLTVPTASAAVGWWLF